MVYETCEAIWNELNAEHMPFPTEDMFLTIASDFYNKWNFPNCVGSIDGKHIRIKCPPNSGSMYYNYKSYYSVVLQAVADSRYRFICIDVGGFGKQSDGGTFANSSLFDHLESDSLNVPRPAEVPNSGITLPHVFVGDEAYPLKPYLLRPYSRKDLGENEEIFNYRLSRARRVVECAFGILSSKWRVLLKQLEVRPEKVDKIIKCICLLHNIIIDKEGLQDNTATLTLQRDMAPVGEIRTQRARRNNRASRRAYEIREEFKTYFTGIGSLQNRRVV